MHPAQTAATIDKSMENRQTLGYYKYVGASSAYRIYGRVYKRVHYNGDDSCHECNLKCDGYGPGSLLFMSMDLQPSTEHAYISQLMDESQDAICELCKDKYFEGSVNTGPHNLCEGSRCAEAQDDFIDELESKQIINQSQLSTNKNEDTENTSIKVQGSDIKIGSTNTIRGLGIKSSGVEIKLGSNNSYNQTRFVGCKS